MSTLVLMRGLAGVGKSTLANMIGRELRLPVLDKDDIGDSLYPALKEPETFNYRCYDILWNIVKKQLEIGVDLIVDSPLRIRVDYEMIAAVGKEIGADVRPIRVTCSDIALWRSRLEQRNERMPVHRRWSWEYHMQRYGGAYDAEPVPGECVVDTSESIETNLKRCIEYLSPR